MIRLLRAWWRRVTRGRQILLCQAQQDCTIVIVAGYTVRLDRGDTLEVIVYPAQDPR